MGSQKNAWGICDKTGFRYPLADLVPEYVRGKPTGNLVGKDVADPDHPQNWIDTVQTKDESALRNPRPPRDLEEQRKLFSWNPVGIGNLAAKGVVRSVTAS